MSFSTRRKHKEEDEIAWRCWVLDKIYDIIILIISSSKGRAQRENPGHGKKKTPPSRKQKHAPHTCMYLYIINLRTTNATTKPWNTSKLFADNFASSARNSYYVLRARMAYTPILDGNEKVRTENNRRNSSYYTHTCRCESK